MSTSSDLRRRLSSLRRTKRKLTLWRGVYEGYDPISTLGAGASGGRWNPPGVGVLYTSMDLTTVRAEMVRAAELQGKPEAALFPLTLAQLAVTAEIVELVDDEVLRSLGVEVPFTALTPMRQTQRVGKVAVDVGIEALIVPSVAAPALNAVVIPENLIEEIEITKRRRISSPGRWPKSERP